MTVEGVGEIYRVDRIEDLVIGGERYRLEVVRCTQKSGIEPGALDREPFSVRAYRLVEVELPPGPARAKVWAELTLHNVHEHGQEDRALLEAHATLLDEVKRHRHGK